jgi:hypothetical protein
MSTPIARLRAPRTLSGLVLTLFVMTLSATLPAQTLTLAPGKYEKTSETSMPGRPARPPQKDTVCLGEDDVRDLSKVAAKVADDKVTCKVSDYKVTSATATFTKSCPVPGGNTLVFDVTMTVTSADSYRGAATVRSSGVGIVPAGLTTTTIARRIGTCSK